MSTTINVSNYGDMLAKLLNMELLTYKQFGNYRGEYVAILKDSERIFYFIDKFGSCGGCDWLESESTEWEYDTETEETIYKIDFKIALEYAIQSKPKYILPDFYPQLNFEDNSNKVIIKEKYE